MSTGHKAALAVGARECTVRHYLEALETSQAQAGPQAHARRPSTRGSAAIESQLAAADPLTRLHLVQEQMDLLDERSRVDQVKDLSALEKDFIKAAKAYGERKGITYAAWRAAGVSAGRAAEGRDLAGLGPESARQAAGGAHVAAPSQGAQQHEAVRRSRAARGRPARGAA